MFRAFKIRQKLLFALLLMGMLPLLLVMGISNSTGSAALEKQTYQHLTSIREIKKRLLQDYFNERFSDLAVLASIADHLQLHNGTQALDKVDKDAHAFYTQFKEQGGYYDLFLIDASGHIFYTIEREADYQTGLNDGPYADSNLGGLFRKVTASKSAEIVDFAPYAPSSDAPAAFIAKPILDKKGDIKLIVALQLSIDHLNQVMTARAGQGETGETYLVGPDRLMRSDSYLDPVNRSVLSSFGNPSLGSVDTVASNAALAGGSDTQVIIDYNGNPVLSSYTPFRVKDITWALLSEIDEAEAMAPVAALNMRFAVIVSVSLLLIGAVAYFMARSLTQPLNEMTAYINSLVEGRGDLRQKLAVRTNDEIAELERRFNVFLDKFTDIIRSVSTSTRVIGDATTGMSNTLDRTNEGVNLQHEDTRLATAAIEELNSSVQYVASSAAEALEATQNAYKEINDGMAVTEKTVDVIESLSHEVSQAADVIEKLNDQSKSISTVLEVIHGIAEQTNLLALNAAIEAARAGDAGRGFSVVADEVRNLAARTQSSTQEIQQIIEGLQQQARHSVTVMNAGKLSADKGVDHVKHTGEYFERITNAMRVLAEQNSHIADASERQADFAEGIHQHIKHMDQVADNTASGTLETRRHGEQLAQLCHQLESLVNKFQVKMEESTAVTVDVKPQGDKRV